MIEPVVAECTPALADLMASAEPAGRNYAVTAFANQRAGRVRFLVATAAGEPAASCEATVEHLPRVLNPHVRPECRGRGIGSRLIESAEAVTADHGQLAIWVAEDNPGARWLYLRLGFQPTGRSESITYDAVDDDGRLHTITETNCELVKYWTPSPNTSEHSGLRIDLRSGQQRRRRNAAALGASMTVVWMFGWVALVLAVGLFGLPRWRTDRPKLSTIACAAGFVALPPLEQGAGYRVPYVASGERPPRLSVRVGEPPPLPEVAESSSD